MFVVRAFVVTLFLITLAPALPGCATHRQVDGMAIKDEDVQQIVDGRTTMSDVIQMFGEPTKATPMGDETIYTYEYRVNKSQTMFFPYVSSGEGKSESDKLSIVFDKNKVVKTHTLKRGVS